MPISWGQSPQVFLSGTTEVKSEMRNRWLETLSPGSLLLGRDWSMVLSTETTLSLFPGSGTTWATGDLGTWEQPLEGLKEREQLQEPLRLPHVSCSAPA